MKRLEFVNVLKKVMPGVDQKENIMGLDSVLFDEDWICSYNDLISISLPFDTKIKGSVKADELFKVVSRMEGEEISLKISEGKNPQLIAKSGSTILKMTLMKEDSIREKINFLELDKVTWKELPLDFKESMEFCSYSSSSDPVLGILSGIHFHNEYVLSTDNFRISQYITKGNWNVSFTIPTDSSKRLLKIDENFTQLGLTKAWVHFKTLSGILVSSKLMAGTYPIDNVLRILARPTNVEKYELPKGLTSAIDRAGILAGSETDELASATYIVLNRERESLIIRGRKDIGEIIETIEWKEKQMPEGANMAISPSFLKKILPITREFLLGEKQGFFLFSTENFKHFIVALAGRK